VCGDDKVGTIIIKGFMNCNNNLGLIMKTSRITKICSPGEIHCGSNDVCTCMVWRSISALTDIKKKITDFLSNNM
jgi:hypothetical protein